jgi:hypothetical protein
MTPKLSKTLQNRLANLEQRKGPRSATLFFEDGSTRAIGLRNPLSIFCAACSVWHELLYGPAEPTVPNEPRSRPATDREIQMVRLIGRAVRVESEDRFIHTIWDICRNGGLYNGKTIEEVGGDARLRGSDKSDNATSGTL